MVGLSLQLRAQKVQQMFPGIKISATSIWRIYKDKNIKRKKVVFKKLTDNAKQRQIDDQIKNCRQELQEHYDKKRTILYLDETMFTKKTYQPKEYSVKRQNIWVD